jgi:hypothetical protein
MDDTAIFRLLAALVTVARRDARKGSLQAAAWLAELEACRPRSIRILQG